MIEYYKELRNHYLKELVGKNSVDVIEDTIFNGDKIYVLSYQVNASPRIHRIEPVKTIYSER